MELDLCREVGCFWRLLSIVEIVLLINDSLLLRVVLLFGVPL